MKHWPASIAPMILLALCCSIPICAQSRLAPATYISHFQPGPEVAPQSGSRDGWESFPLAQEAGYDPTVNPETSAGVSALVREAAPLQDGLFQLGFIRRLHMVTGPTASLRVKVKVPHTLARTTLHILLWRGQQEESHTLIVRGVGWQQIDCPLPANPAPLSAVAIATDFPHAVHGRLERFLIRDVRIKALSTRRIDIAEPRAMWDASRELYYIQQAFHSGERLAASIEQRFVDIQWTLTAPGGRQAGQGSGASVDYLFTTADRPGIYTLTLSNSRASTTALLLLKPSSSSGLFFDQAPTISPGLLQSIRDRRTALAKMVRPETGANIAAMDSHWLLPGLPSYFSILLQSPELAMLDAMEYSATHDPIALARSIALLRSIAAWPEWVHPWFPAHGYHSYYPVGIMTKYLVLAEQFLGSDLSEDDRKLLDHRLMELSVKPIYEEYVHEDRLQFDTSNWIGNTAGGALLAALASDAPDAAGYALGLYVKERDHVYAAYTTDGSYGEGITYQRFDLEMTSLVGAASKRLLSESFDPVLTGGEGYLRYAAYSPDGVLDFGDSHVDLRPSNVFAYQASLNNSSGLADFYFKYLDAGTVQIISRVLFEPSIQTHASARPQLPLSHLFEQRGIAVLRDGWADASTVIAMRAGPNYNHNHADEGSLFFAKSGKIWLGEAGYADYYKDPAYPTFNIQAAGHNTLLVDGNPQSQTIPGNTVFGTYPRITHNFIGESASFVQANLTSVYSGTLQHYTRSLFFQTGGPLIVVDEIEAATPRTFTTLWHPKQSIADFSADSRSFRLSDGHSTLVLQTFGAMPLAAIETPSPFPLADYEASEHGLVSAPVHFEMSTTVPSRNATIVTLIQLQDLSHPQDDAKWSISSGSKTLSLQDSGLEIGGSGGDHSITAWWKQGAFLLNGTRYISSDRRESITADRPIDMQILLSENSLMRVDIDATAPTDLQLQGLRSARSAHCKPGSLCGSLIHIPVGHTSLSLQKTEAQHRP